MELIEDVNILTLDEVAFQNALRCMYFLAKKEIPHTTNSVDLKELCIQLANITFPDLVKGKNANYQSETIMAEMVEAIGVTLEEKELEDIKKSPYYSLIMDEATDILVTKQLGLCVQYLGSDAEVRTRNLKLFELSQATADVITDSIVNYLTNSAPIVLNLSQLAGGTCDGASVMVGAHSGVITRLKEQIPNFIATHCVAHRLSLATCNAVEKSCLVKRFQRILSEVYVYFSRSTVRTAELMKMEQALNEPELRMQRPTETRWLSHQSAVNALRRCFKSVMLTLEQDAANEMQ